MCECKSYACCLARRLEAIGPERGRRRSSKYLMGSMCSCCPALVWRQKRTPWHLWSSAAQQLARIERVRDNKIHGEMSEKLVLHSLQIYFVCEGKAWWFNKRCNKMQGRAVRRKLTKAWRKALIFDSRDVSGNSWAHWFLILLGNMTD